MRVGRAACVFRRLGSPRRRANDIAIGVTAATINARLVSRNRGDFVGILGLEVETAVDRGHSVASTETIVAAISWPETVMPAAN